MLRAHKLVNYFQSKSGVPNTPPHFCLCSLNSDYTTKHRNTFTILSFYAAF